MNGHPPNRAVVPKTMNAQWHRSHPMPPRPSLEQRLQWHIAHAKACACRTIPASIQAELRKRRRGAARAGRQGRKEERR
jgi:hypothetical protein